jgi:sarcosine oxidase subunit beta
VTRTEADVAIVGGGLVGCMAAYWLRKRGRSVEVIERSLVGGESSGVSFGSLRLQGQHDDELPFALLAHELWERVESDLGESVEFAQHGHVHLALDDEQVARLTANAERLRRFGMEAEWLDRNQVARRWPFLSDRVVAASWSKRDAVVNPRLVAPAFARAALRLGAVISERSEVIGAALANGRFALRVRASGGEDRIVESAFLINAAGAWCNAIAGFFGESIPVFPAGPAEMVTEPIPHFVDPVMHAVDGSVLFRQTNRGNVVIGGHPRMKVDAETRRTRVPPEKIRTNLARLVAIAPHMRAHHLIRTWTGIEGYVADMTPVMGPSATTPGLFHACAFSGHGLQLGPAVAKVLSDLIADGSTDAPIAAFDIRRFGAGPSNRLYSVAEEFQPDVARRGTPA